MTDRERLIELLKRTEYQFTVTHSLMVENVADDLLQHGVTVQREPRPLEEWGEDYGDVLWWAFPIEEPPYVGSPLDENWPGYHTHWTPIAVPEPPKEGR